MRGMYTLKTPGVILFIKWDLIMTITQGHTALMGVFLIKMYKTCKPMAGITKRLLDITTSSRRLSNKRATEVRVNLWLRVLMTVFPKASPLMIFYNQRLKQGSNEFSWAFLALKIQRRGQATFRVMNVPLEIRLNLSKICQRWVYGRRSLWELGPRCAAWQRTPAGREGGRAWW